MITEDYVSFEISKLLKEKGFPQELGEEGCINTIPYYIQNGHLVTCDINTIRQRYCPEAAAPTLQMTMKWLREIHKMDIDIVSRLSLNADNDHNYSYIIKHQYDKYCYSTYTDGEYLKYEEACEAAIKYCLEIL